MFVHSSSLFVLSLDWLTLLHIFFLLSTLNAYLFSCNFWTWMPFFSSSLYSFCALALKFNAWLHSFSHHYIVVLYLHCCALAIVPNGILHLLQTFNYGEANCVHVFTFNVWHLIIVAPCMFYYIYSFAIWFTSFVFLFILFLSILCWFFLQYPLKICVFCLWCRNLCSIVTIFIDPHTFYFLHVMFFCFVHVIESCCDGCQKGCKHLKTNWSFGSTTSNLVVLSLLELLLDDQVF